MTCKLFCCCYLNEQSEHEQTVSELKNENDHVNEEAAKYRAKVNRLEEALSIKEEENDKTRKYLLL